VYTSTARPTAPITRPDVPRVPRSGGDYERERQRASIVPERNEVSGSAHFMIRDVCL
jgi:hypothetical protein